MACDNTKSTAEINTTAKKRSPRLKAWCREKLFIVNQMPEPRAV
jgi:hypothetical protein